MNELEPEIISKSEIENYDIKNIQSHNLILNSQEKLSVNSGKKKRKKFRCLKIKSQNTDKSIDEMIPQKNISDLFEVQISI